jgi:predicted SprT family Zn-dependent metalloprotease
MNRLHPIQELLELKGVMSQADLRYWTFKYGLNQEAIDLGQRVKSRLSNYYHTAKAKWPEIKMPFVNVMYLDLGDSLGCACYELNTIVLDPIYALYDPAYATEITLPHEYAHMIDLVQGSGKQIAHPHGSEWQLICKGITGTTLSEIHVMPTKDLVKSTLEQRKAITKEDFLFLKGEDYNG